MTQQPTLLDILPVPAAPVTPKKGKGKKTTRVAVNDTPDVVPYGLVSTPSFSLGMKGTTLTSVDDVVLPQYGVEITGPNQTKRAQANDAARELLAELWPDPRQPHRALTDDEKDTLRAYSGGGNLGESTDAYYTPTRVAFLTWQILIALDPTARRVLEPSCGTGVFIGTAPGGMRITGVEYDPDAARIAQMLHPSAHVHPNAFETYHTTSPDPLADIVIGNSPYGSRGETRATDPKYRHVTRAERYFLTAGMHRLTSGGLLAFIVPHHLLGDSSRTFRDELLRLGTVLAAPVIPEGAFRDTGAGVTTLMLIMRRHDHGVTEALNALTEQGREALRSSIDQAFLDGTLGIKDGRVQYPHLCEDTTVHTNQYGQPTVRGAVKLTGAVAAAIIHQAKRNMGNAITSAAMTAFLRSGKTGLQGADADIITRTMRDAPRHAIPDGTESPCKAYVFRRGAWRYANLLATPEAQAILKLARALQRQQLNGEDDDLTPLWDAVRQYAQDDQSREAQLTTIRRIARTYPTVNLVLHPPTIQPRRTAMILPGAPEDVATQLAHAWELTRNRLMEETGLSDADAGALLIKHYRFDGKRWVPPLEYDFGHAYEKAAAARDLAVNFPHGSAEHEALLTQADRLEHMAAQQARSLADIPLTPRDPIIPTDALQAWVNAYLGTTDTSSVRETVPSTDPDEPSTQTGDATGTRTITRTVTEDRLLLVRDRGLTRIVPRHGHDSDRYHINARLTERLQRYLNFDTETDRITRTDMTPEEIEAQKVAALRKAVKYERSLELHFRAWLQNSEFAADVEDTYNRVRNAYVTGPEDTTLLNLPEWTGPTHHLYQRGDIRTLAAWGHGLLAYDVGLGKTFTLLGLLSLLKKRGEAQRPWIVTPLSLTGNWVMNAHKARPDWKVVVIGMNPTGTFDEDGLPEFEPDSTPERQAKLATLLSQPYDLVIISLEAFTAIPMLEATRLSLIERDAAQLAQAAQDEGFSVDHNRFRGRKALVKEEDFLANLALRGRTATESDLPFELFAPDVVAYEEAHKLKNLHEAPDYLGSGKPKFMGAGLASQRAYDAYLKARWIREQQAGRGTYSLTGTPYKNSPLEVAYALALITDDLTAFGLDTPAAFMLQYCLIEPTIVTNPDGSVGTRPAVTGFKNLKELRTLMRAHIIARDAQTCRLDHRIGLPIPPLQRHIHTLELTPQQEQAYIPEREAARKPAMDGDNHLFAIFNRMRQLIIHPEATCGGRNPRAEKAAEIALDAETTGHKSVSFLDRGGDGEENSAYEAYRQAYIRAGIPADAIEVITAKTHKDAVTRLAAEKRFRQGRTRHIIGSSVIREGFNLQFMTKHLIHIDLPNDPEDVKQRDGRGWRQGNPATEIHSHFLLARGSYDALAYTNIQGKKGWLDHLASDADSGSNPVAFQAAQTALLLATDPDEVAAFLKEREEKLKAEAARLEERANWETVEQFIARATLLRERLAKAAGRKDGPTKQDAQSVERLTAELQQSARAVRVLPDALKRGLTFTRTITFVNGMPLAHGTTFTLGDRAYTVKTVTEEHVNAVGGALLAFDDLEPASGFALPDDESLFTGDALSGLPGNVQGDIRAILADVTEVEATEGAEGTGELEPEAPSLTESAAPDLTDGEGEPAAPTVTLEAAYEAHEAVSAIPTVPAAPVVYAGDRVIRITTRATTPAVFQPGKAGLRPIPTDTVPGEGVMLLGVSDSVVELIAAPMTARQLQGIMDRSPSDIVDRVQMLLQLPSVN